jgi:hypothetical protein
LHRLDRTSFRLAHLFDHLVGARQKHWRDLDAERPRGLEVDEQFVLCRRLHRKNGGLLALKDAIDVTGRMPVLVEQIGTIGDEAAGRGVVAGRVFGSKTTSENHF